MDPLRPGPPGTGGIPLTEEWFRAQKKALKEAGMDRGSPAEEARESLTLSEAAQKLPSTKPDKFLESIMGDIQPDDTLPEATEKMVDSALEQEFGESVKRRKGYPKMKHEIANTILGDPQYREVVEDFLRSVLEHKGRQGGEHSPEA